MFVSVMQINSGKCPYWDVDVSVQGIYGERSDGSWTFLRAKCPIIENERLPIYEQCPEYKYMKCPDHHSCDLYRRFQPLATSDI